MKKLLISVLYTCSVSLFAMELQQTKKIEAQSYNANYILTNLSQELFDACVLRRDSPIEQNIKTALALSATCTHFKLSDLGRTLHHYNSAAKNKMLGELLQRIQIDGYKLYRRAALLLIHAGANDNSAHHFFSLLSESAMANDKEMIEILFKNGANPNRLNEFSFPVFYTIKNVDIANLFAKAGCNFHAIKSEEDKTNVLMHCFSCVMPAKLIQFYCDRSVDVCGIDSRERCLLHHIANVEYRVIFNADDYMRATEWILSKAQHLINTLDCTGKTPLDRALASNFNVFSRYKKISFIALFKKYGAKTAQELQEILLNHFYESGDVLYQLAKSLCIVHDFSKDTKTSFCSLSQTNKALNLYYNNEKTQQKIISYCQECCGNSTLKIAQVLCCHKITKKIEAIHRKASSKDEHFTDQDLQADNAWYLNSTTDGHSLSKYMYHSLTSRVIWCADVEKAIILINNPYINLLAAHQQLWKNIVFARFSSKFDENILKICSYLLQKISPDHRNNPCEFTGLMWAAKGDKALARLFLEHGANPFLLCADLDKKYSIHDTYDHIKGIPDDKCLTNAFRMETGAPRGWLQLMYDEIKRANAK